MVEFSDPFGLERKEPIRQEKEKDRSLLEKAQVSSPAWLQIFSIDLSQCAGGKAYSDHPTSRLHRMLTGHPSLMFVVVFCVVGGCLCRLGCLVCLKRERTNECMCSMLLLESQGLLRRNHLLHLLGMIRRRAQGAGVESTS